MPLIIGILRIALPIIIILVIFRMIWPRYKRYKQQQSNRIEVEAKVVKSEQHSSQYPKSEQVEPPEPKES